MRTDPPPAPASTEALAQLWRSSRVIDLNHVVEAGMPTWPTHPLFELTPWERYEDDVSMMNKLTLGEHTGTHVDAPAHFVAGAADASDVDLALCAGRAVTIRLTGADASHAVTASQLRDWEQANVRFRQGDIVLFDFGWAARWSVDTPERFLQPWPGVGVDAAHHLVDSGVLAIGTDAPSIDVGGSEDFPAHQVILGMGGLVYENLANLDQVPSVSFFLGLPLRIRHGSGTPVRAVAICER